VADGAAAAASAAGVAGVRAAPPGAVVGAAVSGVAAVWLVAGAEFVQPDAMAASSTAVANLVRILKSPL
jgi:hypothetical protein